MTDIEEQLKQELKIEAVLFSVGKSISLAQIMKVLDCDSSTAKKVIRRIVEKYSQPDRAVKVIELDGKYQMCSKEIYRDDILKIIGSPKKLELSQSLLETLSVIAYKQPVTRADIESIRGTSSDYAIQKLLEFGLIREGGHLDTQGRPTLFVTSEDFLRKFGVSSTKELPPITYEEELSIVKTADEAYPLSLQECNESITRREYD